MKKIENFNRCLNVLKKADFDKGFEDEIYRTGIIGQFNLTFELAWKALQEVLRLHGSMEAVTGSPREILQIAYKMGFLDDQTVWLAMLKNRNLSIHFYDDDKIDEMVLLIRDSFLPAFVKLSVVLDRKITELSEEEKNDVDV